MIIAAFSGVAANLSAFKTVLYTCNIEFALFLLIIPIGLMCLYPKDFPGPRLSSQLKDMEYVMTNKNEMCITREDLDRITGKDLSPWRPSDNPMVESEYTAELRGTKATYYIKASRWKDDDGIYLSLLPVMDQSYGWGSGRKILYVAQDTSASSLQGRVVRIYTADGFFYSMIVYDFVPAVRRTYRSKFSRFFEDFRRRTFRSRMYVDPSASLSIIP